MLANYMVCFETGYKENMVRSPEVAAFTKAAVFSNGVWWFKTVNNAFHFTSVLPIDEIALSVEESFKRTDFVVAQLADDYGKSLHKD